ncbi:hypothetical protein PM082_011024 [Marasmius tenuissimus]|nr:hypothetical protein PM082_011024 [Marasmius tenuissimus]
MANTPEYPTRTSTASSEPRYKRGEHHRSTADGPAHPSEENFLVSHFHRETLGGTKIMKETKHAQKTLQKYKLVSPIPTASNKKGQQASNPKKQTPWQKKTGRSPYVKQQHRDVAPSPSPSSSGSSSTDGEGAE